MGPFEHSPCHATMRQSLLAPNTGAPDPRTSTGVVMVGRRLRSVRVFRQFVCLEVSSGKMASSRPAHQRVPASC